MQKFYGLIFLLLFEVALAVNYGQDLGLVQAQDGTPSVPSPQTQTVETQELSGTLLKIEGQTLSIETDDGVQQVTLTEAINVTRNGFDAPLSELEPNDSIKVTQTSAGEVLSVESTSGEVGDISKLVIPALIVGAIVLALILLMTRKAKQPHIKTETGQV